MGSGPSQITPIPTIPGTEGGNPFNGDN